MNLRSSLRLSSLRALVLPTSMLIVLVGPGPERTSAEQAKGDPPPGRVAVGKSVVPTGTLLRREAPDKAWQVVKDGETVYSGDLLLGASGAAVDSLNGAVRLAFLSDLGGTSPFPIVETAVTLNQTKEADLDCSLDRGRVEFSNRKDKAAAKVVGRILNRKAGEIALDPGASCSLELFGRWAAGVPFRKDAKEDHVPTLHVIFVVTKGEVSLKLAQTTLAMKAPPGPALIEWDSVHGGDPSPQRLDKLPDWAAGEDKSDLAQKRKAMLAQFGQLIVGKSPAAAIDEFLNSDDPNKRRLAVNVMAAMDDLERLSLALNNAKYPDVWDNGVLALRHWIGRGPGQDQKLYEGLVRQKGWTPVDAETVLQLLHSFGEAELARPETYETLIDYLAHDRLGIRGLASWHLARLVPAGKKIGYDPLASKEARDKAVAEWRKIVPRGKLPPKAAPDKS